MNLHAGQPVNADGAAGGVAPELDELLDGEDTSQVLDRSAVLGMASLELVVSDWVAGDPSDVGNADHVAVQVGLKNTGTASWAASVKSAFERIMCKYAVSSGLDLGGLLQVLCMSVHLSQHSADPVVLDAEFLDPLLVIGAGLVRDGHVLELSFLGEVDVVHGTQCQLAIGSVRLGYPHLYNRDPMKVRPIGV